MDAPNSSSRAESSTQLQGPALSPRPRLIRMVLVVLLIDSALTALRGVDFVRFAFTESRFAAVGVVLWIGVSALSVLLFRRFRLWAEAGFPQPGRAFAAAAYAYLLFALALGLTLEYLADLVRGGLARNWGRRAQPHPHLSRSDADLRSGDDDSPDHRGDQEEGRSEFAAPLPPLYLEADQPAR